MTTNDDHSNVVPQTTQTIPTLQQFKTWLCTGDSEGSALDAAADIGTGAENGEMLLDAAATTLGMSASAPWSEATSFLTEELGSALSLVGKAGQGAAAFSVIGNILAGKPQEGLFGAIDFGVYSSIGRAALVTAGPSRGTSIALA